MLILLPPSEGKTGPRRGRGLDLDALSLPELTGARTAVLDALVELCQGPTQAAVEALGLTPGLTGHVEANALLRSAPTARADRVYSGVLYDALDAATLSPAARRRATARVLVTSALFGVVGPADRIPAYRLSGDVTLPAIGAVAAHWRTALGDVLPGVVGDGLLVDLRSTTYAAFWRPSAPTSTRVATVRVLQESQGRRSVVSHFNKATKGRLVRALLESGAHPRTPGALAEAWRDLGWHVEQAEPTRSGTRLDVVVSEI